MITEIKKGDRFLCLNKEPGTRFVKGKIYTAILDDVLENDLEAVQVDMHNSQQRDNFNKDFAAVQDEDTQQDLTREAIEQDEVERSTTAQINWNKITENYNKVEDLIKERTAKSTSTFQSITASLGDLLAYKNAKYGNSALEPINVFANKSKVGQRLDDKISRVRNSPELRKNDVADIIGYLILVCQENNWTNFDEFKD